MLVLGNIGNPTVRLMLHCDIIPATKHYTLQPVITTNIQDKEVWRRSLQHLNHVLCQIRLSYNKEILT